MDDDPQPVLQGAKLVVTLEHPATDEQVLGALGKRVTDKLASLVVIVPRKLSAFDMEALPFAHTVTLRS